MRPYFPNVHKIAVLRANAVGDFVFGLPALAALKRRYPSAEIVLMGRPWHAEFLAGRPGPIDRVEVIPPYTGLHEVSVREENEEEQRAFFTRMQGEGFDLAIQLHGGGRHSNPFVKQLGAKVTVGAKTPDADALDLWVPYVREQREVLSLLDIVSLVGAMPDDIHPRLCVTEADRFESEQVLGTMIGDDPIVVLNPGATDSRRRWPPASFAALGDVFTNLGARVVINGARGEEALCAAVTMSMRTPVDEVCGRLSLNGLLGLLSRSRILVSNDTGALHLGMAVGTSVVGIYWGFNLLTSGPMTNFRNRMLASWQSACSQCGQSGLEAHCGHDESFVVGVSPQDVLQAALELYHAPRETFGRAEEPQKFPRAV